MSDRTEVCVRWTAAMAEGLCGLALAASVVLLGGAAPWFQPLWLCLLTLSGVLWFFPLVMKGRIEFPVGLADLPAALFFLLGTASFFFSDVPYEARQAMTVLAGYGLLYFVGGRFLCEKKRLYRLAIGVLLVAGVDAGYGAIAYFRGEPFALVWPKPDQYILRASGSFINPNHFCALMELAVPLALAVLALPKVSLSRKIIAGYLACLMILAALLSYSRSGWVGLGIAVIFEGAFLLRKRKVLLSWLLGVLAAAVIVALLLRVSGTGDVLLERAKLSSLSEYQVAEARWTIWQDTLRMALIYPISGVGLGAYPWRFSSMQSVDVSRYKVDYAHNDYLQTAAELGVPALALGCAALGGVLLSGFLARQEVPNRKIKGLLLGMIAGMVGVACHALTDFPLRIPAIGGLVAVFAGVLVAFSAQKGLRGIVLGTKHPLGPGMRKFLALVLLFLAGQAVWVCVKLTSANVWSSRGQIYRDNLYWEPALECFSKAIRWDPKDWISQAEIADIYLIRSSWGVNSGQRDRLIQQAQQGYERCLRLNPYHGKTYAKLSRLALMRGNREEADLLYQKALDVAPFNEPLRIQYERIFKKKAKRRPEV